MFAIRNHKLTRQLFLIILGLSALVWFVVILNQIASAVVPERPLETELRPCVDEQHPCKGPCGNLLGTCSLRSEGTCRTDACPPPKEATGPLGGVPPLAPEPD